MSDAEQTAGLWLREFGTLESVEVVCVGTVRIDYKLKLSLIRIIRITLKSSCASPLHQSLKNPTAGFQRTLQFHFLRMKLQNLHSNPPFNAPFLIKLSK